MAFSGVPMMIGGGDAEHSGDLMRKLIANFFYGTEGVIRDTDLRILPLPAADGAVRMSPGGVAIANRSAPAGREAFFDFNDQDVTIPIAPTGSSGPRSDLVMARVEDPNSAGTQWQQPADPARGPYIFARVEPNVARNVYAAAQLGRGWSAVALARIDQPANNTAITAAMITDLRPMANGPQRFVPPDTSGAGGGNTGTTTPPPPTSTPSVPVVPQLDQATWTESRIQPVSQTLAHTDRAFVAFPSSAAWDVPIPAWANGVDIFAVVQNPAQHGGNVWGEVRVGIGTFYGTPMKFDMDAISTSAPNRIPMFYSTTLAWNRSDNIAGTVKRFNMQAKMYDDAKTRGRMVADTSTVTYINLSFKRYPIIN